MSLRMALMVMLGICTLACTACMNLGLSTSPAARFYMLEATVETRMSTGLQDGPADTILGVGPVTIPLYLDRPQLVSRLEGSELRVDDFRLWAEPLKANILRVIQENLAVLTDAKQVYSYPQKRSVAVDYQITLDVLRFDADADGKVTLKSVWRIVESDGHERVMEMRSTIVQPSGSSAIADVVDAMSMGAERCRLLKLTMVLTPRHASTLFSGHQIQVKGRHLLQGRVEAALYFARVHHFQISPAPAAQVHPVFRFVIAVEVFQGSAVPVAAKRTGQPLYRPAVPAEPAVKPLAALGVQLPDNGGTAAHRAAASIPPRWAAGRQLPRTGFDTGFGGQVEQQGEHVRRYVHRLGQILYPAAPVERIIQKNIHRHAFGHGLRQRIAGTAQLFTGQRRNPADLRQQRSAAAGWSTVNAAGSMSEKPSAVLITSADSSTWIAAGQV
jgi:uncharacterized lipoprotein YmbA